MNTSPVQILHHSAQSISFQIEDLERPKALLKEQPVQQILRSFAPKLEASSFTDEKLVANGYHAFLYGMYRAYADHRPFVLSADMIWLLICQGFSHHVNFNPQLTKDLFPKLIHKEALEFRTNEVKLGDLGSPWRKAPAHFIEQMKGKIDPGLIDTLRADFSTTGPNERLATEITIMDTFKAYFEYILVDLICGIPEITLKGTTEDWFKIKQKLSVLRLYQLDWWIDAMLPIIDECIAANQGQINQAFWMNMFKVHTSDDYGGPQNIDGWILRFFPYDRRGKKIDISQIKELSVEDILEELPKEIVCVDFTYCMEDEYGQIKKTFPMHFWAGFIGCSQNHETQAIQPEIGWFVSHLDFRKSAVPMEGRRTKNNASCAFYNLESFPRILFKKFRWSRVILNFRSEIEVPITALFLSISFLILDGPISEKTIAKLTKRYRLKRTIVYVNGEPLHPEKGPFP